jgi:hypothetical protein
VQEEQRVTHLALQDARLDVDRIVAFNRVHNNVLQPAEPRQMEPIIRTQAVRGSNRFGCVVGSAEFMVARATVASLTFSAAAKNAATAAKFWAKHRVAVLAAEAALKAADGDLSKLRNACARHLAHRARLQGQGRGGGRVARRGGGGAPSEWHDAHARGRRATRRRRRGRSRQLCRELPVVRYDVRCRSASSRAPRQLAWPRPCSTTTTTVRGRLRVTGTCYVASAWFIGGRGAAFERSVLT